MMFTDSLISMTPDRPRAIDPRARVGVDGLTFGERLRAARIDAGYTSQAALSRAVQISSVQGWKHETDRVMPSPMVIKTYCELLRVTEIYLVHGIGEARIPPAVLDYLKEYKSRELLPSTKEALIRFPWLDVFGSVPTRTIIREVAKLVDANSRQMHCSSDAQSEAGEPSRTGKQAAQARGSRPSKRGPYTKRPRT